MPGSARVHANGINIHYLREGSGPPLILVHGWPEFSAQRAQIKGEAPTLPRIDVPTRVFWGERDPVLKAEWMDRLPEFFSNLQAAVAEGLGHFVHYEEPKRSAEEIARFFTSLP